MTYRLTPVAATLSAGFAAAALIGAAAAETKSFDLDKVTEIRISSGLAAEVVLGAEQSIVVASQNGEFDDIRIEARNGVLHIGRPKKFRSFGYKRNKYKVHATLTRLTGIDASSGAWISATGLKDDDMSIDASSGAFVSAEGACGDVNIDISSGADVRVKKLECETAAIDASSGASAYVFADQSIQAEASSGASVIVYGAPSEATIEKSSGGAVRLKK